MLKRYLVVLESESGYSSDEEVKTLEREGDVRDLVGRIAAGNFGALEEGKNLKVIYEVDLFYGKIKRLEPALEKMKIVLKEVKE
jgi:hypothetical protein